MFDIVCHVNMYSSQSFSIFFSFIYMTCCLSIVIKKSFEIMTKKIVLEKINGFLNTFQSYIHAKKYLFPLTPPSQKNCTNFREMQFLNEKSPPKYA